MARDRVVRMFKRTHLMLMLMLMLSAEAGAESKHRCPALYAEALEIVHTQWGTQETYDKVMGMLQKLSKTHPKLGCSETILAEIISTYFVNREGEPREQRLAAMKLADEAIKFNRNLAQAWVSRARLFLKASDFARANENITVALDLEPTLPGAIFAKADLLKQQNQLEESEKWFMKFIESTPNPERKANGYYAIGDMYENFAWASQSEPKAREYLVNRAHTAYKKYIELKPSSWRSNVNYAIFLNGLPQDYDGAEGYAKKALSFADIPMARYHLAAAQYQKLSKKAVGMPEASIIAAAHKIYQTTNVSLDDALAFSPFSSLIKVNLESLRGKLKTQDLPWLKKPSGPPVVKGV